MIDPGSRETLGRLSKLTGCPAQLKLPKSWSSAAG
jgi:hypothetical protein